MLCFEAEAALKLVASVQCCLVECDNDALAVRLKDMIFTSADFGVCVSIGVDEADVQARRMLLNLAENAGLFNGEVPAQLRKPWHLTTPDIAEMDEDNSFGLSVVGKRLEKVLDLRQGQCSLIDRQQVDSRAAQLTGQSLSRSEMESVQCSFFLAMQRLKSDPKEQAVQFLRVSINCR